VLFCSALCSIGQSHSIPRFIGLAFPVCTARDKSKQKRLQNGTGLDSNPKANTFQMNPEG
jgi:hypothetical protein